MSETSTSPAPAEAFFQNAATGQRFCLYYPPANLATCRGGIIYIAAFAEEMNKARRMAAIQARSLAACGYGVLVIDLYGCGDSSGELKNADWDIWKADVLLAIKVLGEKINAPVSLCGLRLGALMALDIAREPSQQLEKIVLWQPVLQASSYLNQFFRLRLASDMLGKKEDAVTNKSVRQMLEEGQTVEVAGYEISPRFVQSIDHLDAAFWHDFSAQLHWLECVSEDNQPISPIRKKLMTHWLDSGVDLHVHSVKSIAFWTTQEITVSHELLTATTNIFKDSLI